MKTKEITIYVSDSGLKILQAGENCGPCIPLEMRFNELARFKHPIKVQIDLPERKVEITESGTFAAFKYTWENSKVDDYEGTWQKMKEKLFGSERGEG